MDYGAIILIAAYIVAVQLATRANAHPLFSVFVAVLVPYLVSLTVQYIIESSHGTPLFASLFPLSSILIVLAQCILGVYIFKKIRDEDGLTSTVAWSIGGFVLIFLVIPYLIGLIRF